MAVQNTGLVIIYLLTPPVILEQFLTPIVSEIVDHHDVDGPIVTPKATIEPVSCACAFE